MSEVRGHIPCQVVYKSLSLYFFAEIRSSRMLACVSSPQPEVRQAAAYGCGVLGQFGGPGLAAAAAQAVPLLCEVIQSPDSRAVENINPTENAISAVTKILQFNGSAVNLDQVFRLSKVITFIQGDFFNWPPP